MVNIRQILWNKYNGNSSSHIILIINGDHNIVWIRMNNKTGIIKCRIVESIMAKLFYCVHILLYYNDMEYKTFNNNKPNPEKGIC